MPIGVRTVVLGGDPSGQHLFAEISSEALVLRARNHSSFTPEANVHLVTLRGESLGRLRELLNQTPPPLEHTGGAVSDHPAA